MLASKHFSCAAKAGGYFVSDKENPVPTADLLQRPDIARRLGPHPGRSLHQRLYDKGRKRIPFGSEFLFRLADRALERFLLAQAVQVAKHVGRCQAQNREKKTLMETVKGLRVADAHGAHRIAVIRFYK